MIPYVIYSSGLREDLKEVADRNGTTGKIKGLNDLYRRYGFGKFDSSAMENIASIRLKRHHDGVSTARLLGQAGIIDLAFHASLIHTWPASIYVGLRRGNKNSVALHLTACEASRGNIELLL